MEIVYTPLRAFTGHLPALFLTFGCGIFCLEWVLYPAAPSGALLLAALAGGFTVLHALAESRLANPRVGIPLTMATVFVLCFLGYPLFRLGWGATELIDFFRR
jgi:hypothetical protein